jgi:hypothetical protein
MITEEESILSFMVPFSFFALLSFVSICVRKVLYSVGLGLLMASIIARSAVDRKRSQWANLTIIMFGYFSSPSDSQQPAFEFSKQHNNASVSIPECATTSNMSSIPDNVLRNILGL